MSLIAAFLWTKSPRCSISTMIFDHDEMKFIFPPKQYFFSHYGFTFRKETKQVIEDFFKHIKTLYEIDQQSIEIEFKIVFQAHDIPYLVPAKESKFVYNKFIKAAKKLNKNMKAIRLKPQLRKLLAGKSLKYFKKELKALHLVSRKRNANFEYHLWTVALHATALTYLGKLYQIRRKLTHLAWQNDAKIALLKKH